jgi:hypothetical protein
VFELPKYAVLFLVKLINIFFVKFVEFCYKFLFKILLFLKLFLTMGLSICPDRVAVSFLFV